MSIPTKITISRILLLPIFIWLWYSSMLGDMTFLSLKSLVITVFFAFLSITDWIDGYIARKYDMVTDLGKFLDPIADKVLVFSAYFLLLDAHLLDPISLTLMMSREFIVAAVRMVAAQEQIVIAADMAGKIKTVAQMMSLLMLLLCLPTVSPFLNLVTYSIYWSSVLLSVYSGGMYVMSYLQHLKNKRSN